MTGVYCHLVIKLFTIVSLATSVQALPSAVQGIYAYRMVYSSSQALRVYWSTVNGSGITYTVCNSTTNGTQCGPPTNARCSAGITGTYTTLYKLYSGQYYYIWVAAVSSGVQGPFSDRYQIRTYSVPGLVNLSVTPFTDKNGLNVTWSRPSGDYLYRVTYRVSFRRSTFSYWKSKYGTSKRQYNISGLAPGTSYVVQVWAVSPIGSGPSVSSYATTYQLPGSVVSLSASPYRYRFSISITWGPPSGSNYPTPVTYRLRYHERPSSGSPGGWSSTVQRTATQRQYTTPALKPGTRYEVEVWAVSSLGDGPNVTTTATTYQLPGQITSLQVRPSTTIFGLIITWGLPSGSNYPTPVTYQLRYRERLSSGSPGGWSSTVRTTATQRQYTTSVLKPGTRYEVEAWTVSAVGNGQGILGTASTLQLPGPVTSLQVRPSTTIFGLIITWGPPSGSNYPTSVTYQLRYRERPDNGPQYSWSSSRNTLNAQYASLALTPGTRYEVEVWAVSSSSAGPTRQVYGTTASGAITGLTVSPHATQRLLTVMWQPPTDITNPNQYKLRYRKTPSGSWSSERTIYLPQTQYTITGLEATTSYEVEVWATLGSGEGSTSRQTATVQGVPDVQLRVDSREADSITVIPSGPSGTVSYKEYGSSSNYTSEPYFNRIVITQLKPNTQYVILYAVTNSHGTGTTEITTFTLAEAPFGLMLAVHSSTSINATWRAPANSQSLTYYVKYSSPLTGQNTLTTRATALALTGLHPHEQYNISVQARNRAGLSLPVYATAKIYSDIPSSAIYKIKSSSTGTDWVNLVWAPPSPQYRNGIIIKYIIDLSSRDDVISVDVENPAFNTPRTVNYNITGLSPGTAYELKVAAATVNGTGPFSSWRTIKTVETAPGPVQNLTFESTSSSSVRITWEEPAIPNGLIQSYKVVYGDVNDSSTLSTTTIKKYATLYRLEEETPYIVSVRARTSAGYGENESIIVFSKQGAPNRAVEDITVEWTSDTSVLVSWTPLSYSEAKGLPLYIITYKPPDGSSVGLDNTTSSSIVITGLNPLVGYIFTVQVTTGNGNNKGDPLSEFVAARLQPIDIRGSVGLFFGGLGAGLLIELLLLGTVCGLYKRRQYRKSKAADTAPKSTSKRTKSDPNSPKVDEEGVYENLPEIRYMSSAPTTGRPGVRIM